MLRNHKTTYLRLRTIHNQIESHRQFHNTPMKISFLLITTTIRGHRKHLPQAQARAHHPGHLQCRLSARFPTSPSPFLVQGSLEIWGLLHHHGEVPLPTTLHMRHMFLLFQRKVHEHRERKNRTLLMPRVLQYRRVGAQHHKDITMMANNHLEKTNV